MYKKLILVSLVLGLSLSSAFAAGNIGNKVNEKEFPQAKSVLPNKPKQPDFIVKGGVQKSVDLTLDKCIELALGNNPDISVAFHDILASDTRIKQVWSNYFPQLSWQTGYSKIKQLQLSDVFNTNLTFKYYIMGQITLQQMLYDFGVTQNQATIKRIEYEGYRATLAGTINDIIYQTKDSYYKLLYSFEARRVAKDNVKKFEMFYNQAKAFYEIGTNPKV
ncbi:MAG: TolC family protein, partial [Clostridiaceae bacterium]|nr:TolC family protein [Clostridiaceae bacterium]